MIHDHQRSHAGLLQMLDYLLGGCPLIIDINSACVFFPLKKTIKANKFDTKQFHQRDILRMADFPVVHNVALDIEGGAYELMGESRGDGVGIGVVLKHDDVLFSPVGVKDIGYLRR